jgi:hypothetical protein
MMKFKRSQRKHWNLKWSLRTLRFNVLMTWSTRYLRKLQHTNLNWSRGSSTLRLIISASLKLYLQSPTNLLP